LVVPRDGKASRHATVGAATCHSRLVVVGLDSPTAMAGLRRFSNGVSHPVGYLASDPVVAASRGLCQVDPRRHDRPADRRDYLASYGAALAFSAETPASPRVFTNCLP